MSNGQHYVRQPAFLFFVRLAQIIISIVVLGLSAYALDYVNKYSSVLDIGYSGEVDQLKTAFGYAVFVVIYTWIAVGYNLVTSTWFIVAWNCWAVLALEVVGVVFWLACFALLGSWASDMEDVMNHKYSESGYSGSGYSGGSYLGGSYSSYFKTRFAKRNIIDDATNAIDDATNAIDDAMKSSQSVWQSGAAASGVAALIWILSIISLVVYSIYLHRHRIDPENEHLPADGSPLKIEEHVHAAELKQQEHVMQQPVA